MRFKTADAPEPDQEFDKWIVKAGGAVLADETAAATAFIMPSVNVTVEATYKDKPIEPPVTVSHTVTFVVENGTWADGSTANKTVQVSDGSKLQAEAMPTGMKAKDGYENGVWIVVPDTTNPVTADVVYTYRFVEKVPVEPPVTVSHTVTFAVENGTWADDTTENKSVQVSDGDKLQAADIPVGMKAKDGYENGVWVVVPDTINPVTADIFIHTDS